MKILNFERLVQIALKRSGSRVLAVGLMYPNRMSPGCTELLLSTGQSLLESKVAEGHGRAVPKHIHYGGCGNNNLT